MTIRNQTTGIAPLKALDFGLNQSIGLSSSRGAEAPLPRPAAPAGLWVVGQQLGCPHMETHDDHFEK